MSSSRKGWETSGPRHWRRSARTLDAYRNQPYGGRVLSEEEIEYFRKLREDKKEEEKDMPFGKGGSKPPSGPSTPKNPGRPTSAPTAPDKNPPMPPNPPGNK